MGGFGGLFEPHFTNFETRRPVTLHYRSPHRHFCIAHVLLISKTRQIAAESIGSNDQITLLRNEGSRIT